MSEPGDTAKPDAPVSPFVTLRWVRADGWRLEAIEGDILGLTGYPAAAFLGGSVEFSSIVHEQDSPDVFERVGVAATSGGAQVQLAYRIVTRDGRERRVWDDTRILRDAQGTPVHFVSFIVAIDHLPAPQDAHAFMAHASHEIRTPLTGIVGLVEALAATPLAPAQREIVGSLRDSSAELMQLVNAMLDLARLEAGAMELHVSNFRLGALCLGAERLFARRAQAKGVALRCHGPAMDIMLRGDAGRIRQILHNLVGNAVKFTDRGAVSIGWGCDPPDRDGRVRISLAVQDTGPGIAPEQLERIFESYRQADASIAARYGGTGLGLTIARALAAMMGGRLWAESRPGEGSTFRFEAVLDVAAEGQSEAAVLQREESNAAARARLSARRPRILAAEDASAIQRVLVLLLCPLGAEVTIARDGVEAVEKFGSAPFDLVLMDSRLPRLAGVEAVTEIRAIERRDGRPRTPVLALTAETQPRTVEAFMKAGADAFLPKPFDPQRLIRIVAALLDETPVPGPD